MNTELLLSRLIYPNLEYPLQSKEVFQTLKYLWSKAGMHWVTEELNPDGTLSNFPFHGYHIVTNTSQFQRKRKKLSLFRHYASS